MISISFPVNRIQEDAVASGTMTHSKPCFIKSGMSRWAIRLESRMGQARLVAKMRWGLSSVSVRSARVSMVISPNAISHKSSPPPLV